MKYPAWAHPHRRMAAGDGEWGEEWGATASQVLGSLGDKENVSELVREDGCTTSAMH